MINRTTRSFRTKTTRILEYRCQDKSYMEEILNIERKEFCHRKGILEFLKCWFCISIFKPIVRDAKWKDLRSSCFLLFLLITDYWLPTAQSNSIQSIFHYAASLSLKHSSVLFQNSTLFGITNVQSFLERTLQRWLMVFEQAAFYWKEQNATKEENSIVCTMQWNL